jgi:polar amino acid transport system substrate-binding protein
VIKDYSYFEELNDYIKKHEKDFSKVQIHAGTDALIRMFQKMALKRVNTIVEDHNVVNYALKYYPKITDVQEVGCVTIDNLYIAFAPGNPKSKQRVAILNKTITDMKNSGELRALLNKYKVDPWFK